MPLLDTETEMSPSATKAPDLSEPPPELEEPLYVERSFNLDALTPKQITWSEIDVFCV